MNENWCLGPVLKAAGCPIRIRPSPVSGLPFPEMDGPWANHVYGGVNRTECTQTIRHVSAGG